MPNACPVCWATSTPEPVPVNVTNNTGPIELGDDVSWQTFEFTKPDSSGGAGLVFTLLKDGTYYTLVAGSDIVVLRNEVDQAPAAFDASALTSIALTDALVDNDETLRIRALVKEV